MNKRIPLTGPEKARYARHLVLPEVGTAGQERLKIGRVLLVGAGGLGSPAALYLAAAGVGTLGVVDPDVVELTNLQRQILHGSSGLNTPKTVSARRRLTDINPHVKVDIHPVRLTSANALETLADFDVVIDGSDNFPTRYLVNDACVLTGKPNVYGSVFRWEGQVAVFGVKGGPCYRCLFREPPPPGLIPNCAEAGVFGALPGVIGSAQAMEAIKLLLGVGEALVGRLQIFDALAARWREVEVRRDPDCPVCGDEPSQSGLIDYAQFCGLGAESDKTDAVPEIQPSELASFMAREPRPFLLDVREPMEWQAMNLSALGAVLVPQGELPGRLDDIPRDRPIVVYCHSGVRSLAMAHHLAGEGYTNVRNLADGIAGVVLTDPSLLR